MQHIKGANVVKLSCNFAGSIFPSGPYKTANKGENIRNNANNSL